MDNQLFNEILDRYIKGLCTPEEKLLVEDWYMSLNEDAPREPLLEDRLQAVQERVRMRLPLPANRPNLFVRYPYISAAATILVLLTVGWGLYVAYQSPVKQLAIKDAIVPGSDKAILTLANGKKINLTDVPNDKETVLSGNVVARQQGTAILFTDNGSSENDQDAVELNTISIPRGGQYKMTLTDGTVIWLNAATSLSFPATFSGAKREVFLKGEAYFEISKDVKHPFIVHSGKQMIEVLGTQFDISAYSDESSIQTTLLEGAVRLNGNIMLKPGQQATYDGKVIKIKEADTDEAIAWKNGEFIFNEEGLASIMRKIGRWYNVDVQFQQASLKDITFSGSIPRSVGIAKLLKRLALTKEVSFKTQDRVITVQPYVQDH